MELLKFTTVFLSFLICNFSSFNAALSNSSSNYDNGSTITGFTASFIAEDFSIIPNLPGIIGTFDPLYDNSVMLNLSIPPVTGLVISPFYDSDIKKSLWIGRVQHSVLSIRPAWVTVYGFDDILSLQNCKGIIGDAEKFARSRVDPANLDLDLDPLSVEGWMTDRHPNHATTDLPVRSIYGDERLHDYLTDRLLPHLGRCYRVDHNSLYIADLFIVKYTGERSGTGSGSGSGSSSGGQSFLESHRDRSPFSFVISLNDGFEGGGTYFPQLDQLWRPKVGGAVLFHGQSLHGGAKVISGTRYIIAGFVEYNDEFDSSSRAISGDNKFKFFMKYYLPETDGMAAKYGFRSGDIVRGIEACYTNNGIGAVSLDDSDVNTNGDVGPVNKDDALSKPSQILRKYVAIDKDPISPHLWSIIASSCEVLDPKANTNIVVERRNKIYRSERKLDY